MCRRFVALERSDVMRIARDIATDLARCERDDRIRAGFAALDPLTSFAGQLQRSVEEEPRGTREAAPSDTVCVIVPTGCGMQLAVADMAWGFELPWKKGLAFNTRLETALRRDGGIWAEAFEHRRCVVPAHAFFESHDRERMRSARTGRSVKRSYRFEGADGGVLLLASVHERGRFSIVTTGPNEAVAGVHDRMPLVLEGDEVARWLAGDCEDLGDRSRVRLAVRPEDADPREGDASGQQELPLF